MASRPEQLPMSGQDPLNDSQESTPGAREGAMDQHSDIAEFPGGNLPGPPGNPEQHIADPASGPAMPGTERGDPETLRSMCEDDEQFVESRRGHEQETELSRQGPLLDEMIGDGGSNPPAELDTLPWQTAGLAGAQGRAAPPEESGGIGAVPPGHRVAGTDPVVRDVEEIGSASFVDEPPGLRKRLLPEAPRARPAPRQPPGETDRDDDGGITLNKCLLVALLLVGVGFGIFDPDSDDPDADPREARLRSTVELPAPGQAWIPDSAEGIPNTMISLSGLLDKLTNDNTQIRMMHLELQGQKDELEGLLSAGNDRLPVESHENLKLLTQHLSEHLSHEESTLAALQGELRDLRQKIGAVEREGLGEADPRRGGRATGALVEERHVNRFLAQKENLVAEALMLRRELDKQRGIIASMREALEILIQRVSTLGGGLEAPTILEGLEEMEHKLAFELERSEIWETVYGTPKGEREKAKEKRQASEQPELVGPTGGLGAPLPNVEASRGAGETPARIPEAPPSNATPEAEFEALADSVKSTFVRLGEAAKGLWRASREEPPAAEGLPPGDQDQGLPGHKAWRRPEKRREGGRGGNGERGERTDSSDGKRGRKEWRKTPGGRKHFEKDGAAREGKRPKEAGKRWKRAGEKGQENGGKRQHHGHSKFWRKERALRAPKRRYRTPAGCTDVGSCAHKEGMDLFKVALEPVGADRFAALLEEYLRTSELGAAWADDLRGLAAPFFRDGVFIHDQVKFSDFVDDLEDYIEEIAEKVFGDDDAVEDFEDYIFRGLLGEAARKHKSLRKAGRKNADTSRRSGDGSGAPQSGTQDHRKDWDVSQTVGSSEGNLDKRKTEP